MNTLTLCFYSQTKKLQVSEVLKWNKANLWKKAEAIQKFSLFWNGSLTEMGAQ